MWMVLLTVAVGCGEMHYDSRLCAADSIIDVRPDSALALLRAMPRGSITRGDDRAYHALLITEARYKCYESIPSTDTIDLAVGHFASSGDREKLTRSLIYKGATLEELGYLAEAMSFYKQAENQAEPTDYKNIGYVNLRMARLYQDSYSTGREYVDRYLKALICFEKCNELKYQLKTLSKLGAVYRQFKSDSSYIFINKAIGLAKLLNDSASLFTNYEILSRAYWTDSLYSKQKDVAYFNIVNGARFTSLDSYFDIIRAYSKLGKPDSAAHYLKFLNVEDMTKAEYISYLISLKEYNLAIGNYKEAFIISAIDEKISDSIKNASHYNRISKAETEYILKNAELKEQIANIKVRFIIIFSSIIITVLVLLFFLMKSRYSNALLAKQLLIKNMEEDYQEMESIHELAKLELEQKSKEIEIDDYNIKSLQHAFDSQFENVKRIMKVAENAGVMTPVALKKKLDSILFTKIDDSETHKLISLVNLRYNNVIKRLREMHKCLNENELKFIALMYLGYPNSYICFFMGYTNKQSVVNRKLIISQKLGIDKPLMEYLEYFKQVN